MKKRITVFIEHIDNNVDFLFMQSWIKKWRDSIRIHHYSSGGWEHCWDFEAPTEAVKEIPKEWLCASEWAGLSEP